MQSAVVRTMLFFLGDQCTRGNFGRRNRWKETFLDPCLLCWSHFCGSLVWLGPSCRFWTRVGGVAVGVEVVGDLRVYSFFFLWGTFEDLL
jgi:hypothetical protein